MDSLIENFEQYVERHCKDVSYQQACAYADRGEKYLKSFMGTPTIDTQDMAVVGFCIVWCLLKKAYDNKMPFGKGMFLIEFEDDPSYEKVSSLLKILSSSKKTYHRISSHFNERVKNQYGIDNIRKKHSEYVISPYRFSTICFGICTEADGSKSLFIKPELYSFDVFGNPVAAFWHAIEFVKHQFFTHKVEGTKSFRETGKCREDVLHDFIQKGNEIRFVVNASEIGFRVPVNFFAIAENRIEQLLNNIGYLDDDLQLFVINFLDYLRAYNTNVAYETAAFKRISKKHSSDIKSLDHTIILRHKELFKIMESIQSTQEIDELYGQAKKFLTDKLINPTYNPKPLLFFVEEGSRSYKLRTLDEKVKLGNLQKTIDLPTLSRRAVLLG